MQPGGGSPGSEADNIRPLSRLLTRFDAARRGDQDGFAGGSVDRRESPGSRGAASLQQPSGSCFNVARRDWPGSGRVCFGSREL